jgi:DUF1365 family protein
VARGARIGAHLFARNGRGMTASALYHGIVTHRRFRPVTHALRYRIFMLLLDLDETANLPRLLGIDRAGLLSFYQRDHGDGTAGGLRAWIATQLRQAGLPPAPRVRALCMPRVFGHMFNPLTVYFCHAPAGDLQALIYEVNNTFGGRHAYTLAVGGSADRVAHGCDKTFHVSPFMDMDLHYRFRIRPADETVSLVIHADDAVGVLLTAGFAGRRQALSNAGIVRAALGMPWLGLKVLGGIHWEALRLWLKGLKLRPAPPKPSVALSRAP